MPWVVAIYQEAQVQPSISDTAIVESTAMKPFKLGIYPPHILHSVPELPQGVIPKLVALVIFLRRIPVGDTLVIILALRRHLHQYPQGISPNSNLYARHHHNHHPNAEQPRYYHLHRYLVYLCPTHQCWDIFKFRRPAPRLLQAEETKRCTPIRQTKYNLLHHYIKRHLRNEED
jgi:hypothetical protein